MNFSSHKKRNQRQDLVVLLFTMALKAHCSLLFFQVRKTSTSIISAYKISTSLISANEISTSCSIMWATMAIKSGPEGSHYTPGKIDPSGPFRMVQKAHASLPGKWDFYFCHQGKNWLAGPVWSAFYSYLVCVFFEEPARLFVCNSSCSCKCLWVEKSLNNESHMIMKKDHGSERKKLSKLCVFFNSLGVLFWKFSAHIPEN